MKSYFGKRAATAFCAGILALSMTGCQKAAPQQGAAQQGGSNAAEAVETEAAEALPAPVEEDPSQPIYWTYQSHPMSLVSEGQELFSGNYYTVDLEHADRAAFPKLQEKLEQYGEEAHKSLADILKESEDEVLDMFAGGWEVPFEEVRDFIPVRSDGRAFSFVVGDYVYLGGAHGMQTWDSLNLDPKTGEPIPFSSVVKDPDALGPVLADEMVIQNEDLEDYFEESPESREEFLAYMPERMKNDAENLVWALDYDGIRVFFEDYALGSYVAGARSEKILFEEYPELFTEEFTKEFTAAFPSIDEFAKAQKDAELEPIEASKTIDEFMDEAAANGESWWYHAVVENPGWEEWVRSGIDSEPGEPVKLSEVTANKSDWLNAELWSEENDIALPDPIPYADENYEYHTDYDSANETLMLRVSEADTGSLIGNFYFDEYLNPPDTGDGLFSQYTETEIQYAKVVDDVLYAELGHRTYSSAQPHTGYLVAIDINTGELLWRSADLVSNSRNFAVIGDSVVTGYGFTDEPDFLYILNKNNGKVQQKIPVASAPDYFIPEDGYLHVITYDTEYLYAIEE